MKDPIFYFEHAEILRLSESKLRRVVRYLTLYCVHRNTARLQKDVNSIPGVNYHWCSDVKRRLDFSAYPIYLGVTVLNRTFGDVYPNVPTNVVHPEDLALCLDSLRTNDLWSIMATVKPGYRKTEKIDAELWKTIVRTSKMAARKLYFVSKYDPGNTFDDLVNSLLVESIRIYRRYVDEGKTAVELRNFVVRSIWNASKAMIDHATSPTRQRLRRSGEQGREYESTVLSISEASEKYKGLK